MKAIEDLSTATWFKSSHSNTNGGDCLEVARDFVGAATWRKSRHSNSNGGSCLEVADGADSVVPVRDSKDLAQGVLVFPAAAWVPFVSEVKGGSLSGDV
ncbi:DUF397 domain-containing protein [Streptomyces sp. HNM0574]|uniref:DUF397 domain-containing protein n=1 Tax=Streptomyces sp. HNM0574 TaxID=2714954 RepID=UPI00146C29BF|nr:DUF397 domain-containing protein [Streptomyces sp. HNM0574]NLU66772.1 DUF397 domain-containing protein [Streptomyces sp. HNM0574]